MKRLASENELNREREAHKLSHCSSEGPSSEGSESPYIFEIFEKKRVTHILRASLRLHTGFYGRVRM